jgi:hypothetical protein
MFTLVQSNIFSAEMKMYHMASPDVEELHKMADKIGIPRKWFQEHNKGTDFYDPHYDVAKGKKAIAISFGAVEISDRDLVKICFPKMVNAIINGASKK